MKLFDGLEKSDYQDILRALGRIIDEHCYRDIRLFETEDGLILQGRIISSGSDFDQEYETTFFTEKDVEAILTEAYTLRQTRQPAAQKKTVRSQTGALLLDKLRAR